MGKRSHTMEGHATLLYMYMYPKLYDKAQNIPLHKTILKTIEQISFNFIWSDRSDTIKREKLYNQKHLGGLSLHKLDLRQKAFFKQKS